MRLVLSFLLLIGSCKPVAVYPPEPEIVEVTHFDFDPLCRVAWEALARIGCPESYQFNVQCIRRTVEYSKLCIANSSTPEQMRICGVNCDIYY